MSTDLVWLAALLLDWGGTDKSASATDRGQQQAGTWSWAGARDSLRCSQVADVQIDRHLIRGTAGGHAGQGGYGQDREGGEGLREKGAGALDLEGSVGIYLARLGHWELLLQHTCSRQPPAPISVAFRD